MYMPEKTFSSRIRHKNDSEAMWDLVPDFIPKRGELIIYNADDEHSTPRIKVGDGVTVLSRLPYVYEYKSLRADDDNNGTVYIHVTGLESHCDENGIVSIS